MSISQHIDGWDHVTNFERVYLGPGIYVLYDGQVRTDGNIVYIGKSSVEVMMRVSAHARDKTFDRVGIILPRRTGSELIHDLEHLVMAEYVDRYAELPPYNIQMPRLTEEGRAFNWHHMARRRQHVWFE